MITNKMLAFWSPGPMEIVVILAVLVLVFGRRLPEIARNMGKSLTEFKKGVKDGQDEFKNAINESDKAAKNNTFGPDNEDIK